MGFRPVGVRQITRRAVRELLEAGLSPFTLPSEPIRLTDRVVPEIQWKFTEMGTSVEAPDPIGAKWRLSKTRAGRRLGIVEGEVVM